jgi:hypothetical protein
MTIAFMSGGKLVHYARHARWNGNFTSIPKSQPISASAAIFRVVADGNASDSSVWFRLALNAA